jgi:flagellin-like protein
LTRKRNVRNTTKFKRSIRAISPVIATLLMIAIAVVASLVVYAWVTGYIGGSTTKAGKAIQIPSFALDDSGKLHVYVQNVGQGTTQLSAVYVNDALVSSPNDEILEGNTAELVINGPYSENAKLNIKVTTTDGTFMTTTGKAISSGTGSSPAALTGSFAAPLTSTVNIGDIITVTLHVTNTGSASATAVTPGALTLGGTGSATYVSGPSPASATIVGGGSQDFTWTYTAATSGTVTFSGSASSGSVTTGSVGPSNIVTVNTVVLPDVVISNIGITAPAGSNGGTVATNEIFTVTAQIQLSSGSATPVTATLAAPGYTITAPAAVTHSVGTSNVAFAWTVTAPSSALAPTSISVSAPLSGYNTGTGSFSATTVTAAALSGSFTTPATGNVNVGNTITVTLHVTNAGTASATTVAPAALTLGGTGSATLASGPSPASATIVGGGSQDFTWTYTAATSGTVTFSGSATGTAQYSDNSVSTGSVGPSNTVTINGPAGITRVQGAVRGTSTSSTITVTLTNTPTSGNKLIAVIGTYRTNDFTARTVSTITQTGVTWTMQTRQTDSSGNDVRDVEIWLGTVSSGATTPISITLTGTPAGAVADVCEYSGLAASPSDKTAGTDNWGTSTSTGTTTTTAQASELWIGGITVQGNNAQTSSTNGFTNRDGATYNNAMSLSYLEKIVSATGTAYSGTTISSSQYWVGCIATFKGT